MFNSPVLDLVILLSFTYFIGSIMLTAINESISAGLKMRANDLVTTIKNLLIEDGTKDDWKKFVAGKFFASQQIRSLMKDIKDQPSYIPSKNFLMVLIENLDPTNYTQGKIDAAIVNSSIPDVLKKTLQAIWVKASSSVTVKEEQIAAFEKEVETFYNNAMERATGWYKRKMRRIAFVIAILLSIAMNIDTIKITNDALKDKSKLAKTVDNISNSLASIEHSDSVFIINKNDTTRIIQKVTTDTAYTIDTALSKDLKYNVKATITKVKDLQAFYNNQNQGYQMGYGSSEEFIKQWFKDGNTDLDKFLRFLLKMLGIMMSAFAVQLGSGYWFDILNKAVNIRAAGKKPDEQKK
jgi:hypothetical protein